MSSRLVKKKDAFERYKYHRPEEQQHVVRGKKKIAAVESRIYRKKKGGSAGGTKSERKHTYLKKTRV